MQCGALTYSFVTPRRCCLTGSGPGCPDLNVADSSSSSSSTSSLSDVDIIYYYDTSRGGQLRANASCRRRGHVFRQSTPPAQQQQQQQEQQQQQVRGADGVPLPLRSAVSVYCDGLVWSEPLPTKCVGQSHHTHISLFSLSCVIAQTLRWIFFCYFCTTAINSTTEPRRFTRQLHILLPVIETLEATTR